MAKGLLPDYARAMRVRGALLRAAGGRRGDADRRAPELAPLARQGQTWGGKGSKDWGGQKFIQVDISPQEADSNVRIDAPLVGDIGSCVAALLAGIGAAGWVRPGNDWLGSIAERKSRNIEKMAETLAKDPRP
jgi:hypothetical protein